MSLSVAPDECRQQQTAALRFPLTKPNAPKLSAYLGEIEAIEASHWLTNYGPTNHRLETCIVQDVFGGVGHCLTVCNATIGLIIALKLAAQERKKRARYVIMPSFTFAAAAHAVLWAGLTPLLIDIDPTSWSASKAEEERLLELHGDRIAALMPYATFGSCIDLHHYDLMSERYNVPVVVDAAASMGSLEDDGGAFGRGSKHMIIFSMHATKAFGVGECGAIYCADNDRIEALRRMGNFGFDTNRTAIMPGLNSKISELVALSALIKLSDYKAQILHRAELAQIYREELPNWVPQADEGSLVAYQFMPLLVPRELRPYRDLICARLNEAGVGTGRYFCPHIRQQTYFRKRSLAGPLDVTDEVASRIVSFPISDFLTVDDVLQICAEVRRVEDSAREQIPISNVIKEKACSHDAAAL